MAADDLFLVMPHTWCKSGLKPSDWDALPLVERLKYFCKDQDCLKLLPMFTYKHMGFNYCSQVCQVKAQEASFNRDLEILTDAMGLLND